MVNEVVKRSELLIEEGCLKLSQKITHINNMKIPLLSLI